MSNKEANIELMVRFGVLEVRSDDILVVKSPDSINQDELDAITTKLKSIGIPNKVIALGDGWDIGVIRVEAAAPQGWDSV